MQTNAPEQAVPSPADDGSAPPGFLSQEAKQAFTKRVWAVGIIAIVAQFVLPFVFALIAVPVLMISMIFHLKDHDFSGAAAHDGQAWFFSRDIGPGAKKKSAPFTLCRMPISEAAAPERFPSSTAQDPQLVAAGDRLWVITDERVGTVAADGTIAWQDLEEPLVPHSKPFACRGRPALVSVREDGVWIEVLEKGGWQRDRRLSFLEGPDSELTVTKSLRVLPDDEDLLFFSLSGGIVYAASESRIASAGEDAWQTVGAAGKTWHVLRDRSEPAVFTTLKKGNKHRIVEWRLENGTWTEVYSRDVVICEDLGVAPHPDGKTITLLVATFPGSFKLLTVEAGEATDEKRYGSNSPLPRWFMPVMFIPNSVMLIVPLILAWLISGWMATYRVSEFRAGDRAADFASLRRRGVSRIVDSLLLGGPNIAVSIYMFFLFYDVEAMVDRGPFMPLITMGLSLGSLAWALLTLLLLGAMEGAWGQTPGKWLFGIRVAGLDLEPPGFGWGVLRNVLLLVDGMFGFAVGILLASLTENQQRVGDMVAKTVVLRNTGFRPAPVPSPPAGEEGAPSPEEPPPADGGEGDGGDATGGRLW